MREISEYTIAEASTREVLVEKVNSRILEGWQPYGSLSYTHCTDKIGEWYAQPMVKYGD